MLLQSISCYHKASSFDLCPNQKKALQPCGKYICLPHGFYDITNPIVIEITVIGRGAGRETQTGEW